MKNRTPSVVEGYHGNSFAITSIQQYHPLIGHYHTANVPGRHELVGGDLDYRSIFKAINSTGYKGVVGLEFIPAIDTTQALKQAVELAV